MLKGGVYQCITKAHSLFFGGGVFAFGDELRLHDLLFSFKLVVLGRLVLLDVLAPALRIRAVFVWWVCLC